MNVLSKYGRSLAAIAIMAIGAGCASGPSPPPYPAFVQVDELPDLFMASLPGVRAKQFGGNAELRTTSNRIDLPPDWSGTTGGSPSKVLEIFVLAGQLRIADMILGSGAYALLPPGTLGFNMHTDDGARILYFLDDVDPYAAIRTPLILDSGLIDWQATDTIGVLRKNLRADPGSGARTWLLRVETDAIIPWQASTTTREGFLVSGEYQHSECVVGEAYTDVYTSGGYFRRPADAVHGGPESRALTETTWFMRETSASKTRTDVSCAPP